MHLCRIAVRLTAALVVLAAPFAGAAQDYPRKNVQYIIPFVPGG